MAIQIERNGSRFYRQAAEGVGDVSLRQLLLDLADQEVGHERIFSDMLHSLTDEERTPPPAGPDDDPAPYLRALADSQVFDPKADPVDLLKGLESPLDILRTAIGLERVSIDFYLGIKESSPSSRVRGRIDEIIREEMRHVARLGKALAL
jgi:rubrerythrin